MGVVSVVHLRMGLFLTNMGLGFMHACVSAVAAHGD